MTSNDTNGIQRDMVQEAMRVAEESEGSARQCRYYPCRTDADEITDLENVEKLSDELFPSGGPHNR